jgi:hypothetical protein
VPDEAVDPDGAPILPGLTNPRAVGLQRCLIRTRQVSITLSAWRLTIASEQGEGTITLVESPSEETFFRGDGVLLGWDQDRLAGAYAALSPNEQAAALDMPQLG